MTTSIKISVGGSYRATVKHTADGVSQPDTVVDGGTGEKSLWFQHGKVNAFEVTEVYLTDEMREASKAPPAA